MSIDCKKISERHRKFENKIDDDTYKDLEDSYNIIVGQETSSGGFNLPQKGSKDKQSSDIKMKESIRYIRYCSLIESLLVEYEQYDEEEKKHIIDYYINNNSVRELSNIGLSWYYDVKYRKSTATLYSVGYGKGSNWIQWLQNKNVKNNHIKENGIQLIFTACNEHINRGGSVRLKSLSKCFGVDLFKYMQIDNTNIANLYIIKDAPINFIKNNNKEISLQEYLSSKDVFDIKSKPQFCLDFSHPRDKKAKNYNNWSKRFLQNTGYISQAEVDEKKTNYNIEGEQLNHLLLGWLRREHIKDGGKSISSRISPIADQEVIASDTLWLIEDYNTKLKEENIVTEKCYHFRFNVTEYCQLIFNYFEMYAKNHSKQGFRTNYDILINSIKDNISKTLLNLHKEQKKLKDLYGIQLNNEEIEKIKKQYQDNENFIGIYSSYREFLEKIFIEEIPTKIQLVLSFVDWDSEIIPENWSMENIYTIENNNEENLKINIYKCICKMAIGG